MAKCGFRSSSVVDQSGGRKDGFASAENAFGFRLRHWSPEKDEVLFILQVIRTLIFYTLTIIFHYVKTWRLIFHYVKTWPPLGMESYLATTNRMKEQHCSFASLPMFLPFLCFLTRPNAEMRREYVASPLYSTRRCTLESSLFCFPLNTALSTSLLFHLPRNRRVQVRS